MPYLVYRTESAIPIHKIPESLQRFVGRPNWLGAPRDSIPFLGTVDSNGFTISRVIRGRDSFNPVLYGRFFASGHGTRLRVIMTFHPLVWLFLILWSVFNGYTSLEGLLNHHLADFWGCLCFLIFAWVVAVPLFYWNASRSKLLLRQSLGLRDL